MLGRLDRQFAATLTGAQLALLPEETVRALTSKGILDFAGDAETVTRCLCDLKRPRCVVAVAAVAEGYQGYCDEYGTPFPVAAQEVRRYRFDWRAWAAWLRRRNSLAGAEPSMGAGTLYVGCGSSSGRDFALVVVAPGCRRAADLTMPERVRVPGRALVGLPSVSG